MVALVSGGGSFEPFGLSSELGALLLGVILADVSGRCYNQSAFPCAR
jgi:predicted Kef-type K+ transport protein